MDLSSTVFLTESDSAVSETDGVAQARITRSGSLEGDVTVEYGVTGDTATDGADFTGGNYSVTMPSGVAEISVPVPILDDGLAEGTEAFAVSLISVDGASLVAPRTERIHILDDEAPSPEAPPEPPLSSDYDLAPTPVVEGLNQPIRFVFSPVDDTKLYVAEKGGVIRIADTTTGESHVVLDWSDRVNESGDRGLVGLAVHPDLANNPYIYAFMVMDPPDSAEAARAEYGGPDGMGNRYSQVVRFTLDAGTGYSTVVPGSETVILGGAGKSLEDISGHGDIDFTAPWASGYTASDRAINPDNPVPVINGYKQDFLKADAASHNGGDMGFGPDGMLYIATGDATSYNYADPRAPSVQDLDSLNGKILRIDPITGEGLADNPFVTEGVSLDDNRAKVYQLGLRNPFAFTFDHDGKLIVSDTGWNSYEEIDIGGPGANFGWPYYEGGDGGTNLPTPTWRDTAGAAALYEAVAAGTVKITVPFRAFSHEPSDPGYLVQAITSGDAVISGGPYPASLQGSFLFTDFSNANLFAVNTDDRSDLQYLGRWDGVYGPIDYVRGSDGQVWYADLITGQIGKLAITQHLSGSGPQQIGPIGEGPDTLVLKVSQDAWNGNAEYTVTVDGVQLGDVLTAAAAHAGGESDTVTLRGDWGSGPHQVTVEFLNDAWGGGEDTDRNLHVDGITYNGADLADGKADLLGAGPRDFAFEELGGPLSRTVGEGPDRVVLRLSQDAYDGDAQYTVWVDGVQVGGVFAAGALHGSGEADTLTLLGSWGSGGHTVQVDFLNDAWGGGTGADRNLYVDGVSYNGIDQISGNAALRWTGPAGFAVAPTGPEASSAGSGPDAVVLKLSQDAWQGDARFTVSVDGRQVGGEMVAHALHGSGASDTVTLRGEFGPGAHTVEVTFLNDAYGGSADTDRNLYVDGIVQDGAEVPGGTAALLWAGPHAFELVA